MTNEMVSQETLMRYLDGELPPEERARVDRALAGSTELRRELAIFRSLHEDLATLSFHQAATRDSIWTRVHRRLSRPIGWTLVGLGTIAWVVVAVVEYLTSAAPSWQKLASAAIVIGVLLLFASVIHERYREFLADPYRHVER
jgi:anti-sigma factor RsiW